MGKEPPAKIMAAMMIGFALAAVGIDTVTGQLRLIFGFTELMRGFDFLIAVIGLFGIGEILLSMEEGLSFSGRSASINPKVVLQTWAKLPQLLGHIASQLCDRLLDGYHPGGATPASFMSLWRCEAGFVERAEVRDGRARRCRRAGDRCARGGHFRTAANARAGYSRLADGGGAAGRLADLGPSARSAAVRGAERFRVGPHREHVPREHLGTHHRAHVRAAFRRDIAYSVLHHRAHHRGHLRDRCYTVHNAMFDIWLMLLFGLAGYVMKKLNYPLAPLVLALVLGDRAEDAFRQSMLMAQGDLRIFFSNWLVGSIVALALLLLIWPAFSRWRARMRKPAASAAMRRSGT